MVRLINVIVCSLLLTNITYAADRLREDTFNTAHVVRTGVLGLMDSECGGYCIVGACMHLKMTFSLSKGTEYYTVVSPRIQHAVPEFLVSSYSHIGFEPYDEWRNTFGQAFKTINDGLGLMIGSPDGLFGGGAPIYEDLDHYQSTRFKEIDIIGHPLTIIPKMMNSESDSMSFNRPKPPPPATLNDAAMPSADGAPVMAKMPNKPGEDTNQSVNVRYMIDLGLLSTAGSVREAANIALTALEIRDAIDEIQQYITYFQQIAQFARVAMQLSETVTRGSVYGNLINPKFRAPRLMCPTSISAFQPYYLSIADAFYWRSGYPVTDGPLSGSDHSSEILNPFSDDHLPTTANPLNPLSDIWGRMYPRTGYVDHNHKAKGASVTAWRAMDVLQNDVSAGTRVGLKLPRPPNEDILIIGNPKWQMIYPETLSCQSSPYYPPTDATGVTSDFIEINGTEGYAWNYYETYECCSNNSGEYIMSVRFPVSLCLSDLGV